MNFDLVFHRFKMLAGLSDAEADSWTYLVSDCIYQISAMLIPDCDMEENCHRLAAVAAALAFYKYRCVISARGEPSDFKIGDVSVGLDKSVSDNVYKMYLESLDSIGDILRKNDFVFGRIEDVCSEK